MRSTTLAGLAGALALTAFATPARAAGHVTMRCTLTYSTLIGSGTGNGTCTATGAVNGHVLNGTAFQLAFNANNTCPTQSVAGSGFGGGVSLSFQWLRTGTIGAVTSGGDVNGGGSVEFSSPCPANGETAVFSTSGS